MAVCWDKMHSDLTRLKIEQNALLYVIPESVFKALAFPTTKGSYGNGTCSKGQKFL